ncbi:hypothetical protein HL653_20730 [Sphingomonas sp. AP4-R1]|uniref:hypothetical protein n=1 Tax=Sphingomonas sp. AP4-R1 TaxID=2735134 RepID=UPI00149391AE|nr:hypothetical protein [Sphingomonas sp. AP4-R1]QJU59845.1 hypothetical protein HL653_20730 [Sphingomonas sp. AP4-R1]
MRRSRRRPAWPPSRPWTPDEDRTLVELCQIGATCDIWKTVFPDRRFGEVAERRLDLRPPLAPLL